MTPCTHPGMKSFICLKAENGLIIILPTSHRIHQPHLFASSPASGMSERLPPPSFLSTSISLKKSVVQYLQKETIPPIVQYHGIYVTDIFPNVHSTANPPPFDLTIQQRVVSIQAPSAVRRHCPSPLKKYKKNQKFSWLAFRTPKTTFNTLVKQIGSDCPVCFFLRHSCFCLRPRQSTPLGRIRGGRATQKVAHTKPPLGREVSKILVNWTKSEHLRQGHFSHNRLSMGISN